MSHKVQFFLIIFAMLKNLKILTFQLNFSWIRLPFVNFFWIEFFFFFFKFHFNISTIFYFS